MNHSDFVYLICLSLNQEGWRASVKRNDGVEYVEVRCDDKGEEFLFNLKGENMKWPPVVQGELP